MVLGYRDYASSAWNVKCLHVNVVVREWFEQLTSLNFNFVSTVPKFFSDVIANIVMRYHYVIIYNELESQCFLPISYNRRTMQFGN